MNTTARFWHFHNDGPVLIKIRAGETLHHSQGGPTDEGWHRETNVWSFDGVTITSEWHSDGVDCDGRISQYDESACPVSELKSGYVDADYGVTYPAWQQGKHGQRDHSAEAANY